MNKQEIINTLKNKKIRIKGITFVPFWIARLCGKLDSKKPPESIKNVVDKKISSCNAFEAEEFAELNILLTPLRAESGAHIENLKEKKERTTVINTTAVVKNESDLRNKKAFENSVSLKESKIRSTYIALAEIYEIFNSSEEIVKKRVAAARELTLANTHAYLSGVYGKKANLININADNAFNSSTYETYKESCKNLCNRIEKTLKIEKEE